MVLKVESVSDGSNTVLRLSGRIESEDVQDLKTQIDGRTRGIVLDLEQVRLLDLDAVHFLAVCVKRRESSFGIVRSMCGSGLFPKSRGFANSNEPGLE